MNRAIIAKNTKLAVGHISIMKMERTELLKRISWLVGIGASILTFLMAMLNFIMEWKSASVNREGASLSFGSGSYRDMAIRYLGISLFFLLSIIASQIVNKAWSKLIGFFFLLMAVIQCKILISSKPDQIPGWITDFPSKIRLIWEIDCLFLSLAAILIALQIFLINGTRLQHSE